MYIIVDRDRNALVDLYYKTNGNNWKNKTNWLSNEPLSKWHGISVDNTGTVTIINLDSNQLSGNVNLIYNLCNIYFLLYVFFYN